MMQRIETQYTNRKTVLLLIALLFFQRIGAQNIDSIKVITDKGLFLRESCRTGSFSFCSDGYWGSQRASCLIRKTRYRGFVRLYKRGLYVPPYNIGYRELLRGRNIPYNSFESMAHILDSLENISNVHKIYYSQDLRDNVNRLYKRSKIDKKFDGKLRYSQIKVKMECIYIGKKRFSLPNIRKNSRQLFKDVFVDTFLITNIEPW